MEPAAHAPNTTPHPVKALSDANARYRVAGVSAGATRAASPRTGEAAAHARVHGSAMGRDSGASVTHALLSRVKLLLLSRG